MEESERKELNKLVSRNSKSDLMKLCKDRNLDVKGTKFELGMRLIGKKKRVYPIHPPTIIIYRNQFGHYEHQRTGFLFNSEKRVFGKQNEDGTISSLQSDDIMTCRQYKFQYEVPELLDESLPFDIGHFEQNSEDDDEEDSEEEEG